MAAILSFYLSLVNYKMVAVPIFSPQKSLISNIHIYDYMIALPLKNIVTEIYSADDHFQHPDFKEIAPVANPLHPWILREGRIPVKA